MWNHGQLLVCLLTGIAGTVDAMVEFGANAAATPAKLRRGGLLAIEGGSHAGFAAFADMFPLRLLSNPDSIGCAVLTSNLEARTDENPFYALGTAEDGVVFDEEPPMPCSNGELDDALAAGRQLMITRLATLAFFESHFAKDGAERASEASFLRETLARDFPEASFQGAGAG